MQRDACADDASKSRDLKEDVSNGEVDLGSKVKSAPPQPASSSKLQPSNRPKDKNIPALPKSHGKKKPQSSKPTKAAAAPTPSTQPDVPSSPKLVDEPPKVQRSNSKHSSKKRGKDNSRPSSQAFEASPCAPFDPEQLNPGLRRLSLNGMDQVQPFVPAIDKVGNGPEDNATLVDNPSVSNSVGTFTSSAQTPSNASPQLPPADLSNTPMPCPPFQFMPLQPNLYPLFMPAQMQDGRFVFVPVAYPMVNGNRPGHHYAGPDPIPQSAEGSEGHNGQIPRRCSSLIPTTGSSLRMGISPPCPSTMKPSRGLQVVSGPRNMRRNLCLLPRCLGGRCCAPELFEAEQRVPRPLQRLSSETASRIGRFQLYRDLRFLPEALEVINREAELMFQRLSPQPEEKERQENLLSYLRDVLSKLFPDAELHPFGSTANGLGMVNADMDLCVCFPNPIRSKVTAVEFVEHMGTVLQQDGCFAEVKPLTRTRIPIIKLTHRDGLSSDIGFENRLALWNTRMLKTYAEIDSRLKKLVYLVKHWSKQRSINEPYHGTLSSYCYVLMVIFFLQQRSPPVLPCLQMIGPPDLGTPRREVDGHNVYFFDDLPNLNRYWQGENVETVGDLLFGFFQYYAYDFHWSKSVVSVRTGTILSKEQKNWIKPKFSASPSTGASVTDRFWLCVEDPFELDHNLGRPADRTSVFYIRGEFIRATKMLKARDPGVALSRLFQAAAPREDAHQVYPAYGPRSRPQLPLPTLGRFLCFFSPRLALSILRSSAGALTLKFNLARPLRYAASTLGAGSLHAALASPPTARVERPGVIWPYWNRRVSIYGAPSESLKSQGLRVTLRHLAAINVTVAALAEST
ncbi:hypothetical protein L0F63_007129, partial [Massospora cicadina]